ncbi:MAG: hypothetical protein JNJ54_23400 [Myxococcaceae bacterium]|nr:hypothetical protein [Myxococcaceae bacterium]
MKRLLAALILASCQPVAEDATGAIGPMVFETLEDDCRPHRFTGTTGNLFVGTSSGGRLVVSSSLNAFWGPGREDAGALIAGSRTDFATGNDVELVLGGEPSRRCATMRYRWTELGVDGGTRLLELKQLWLAVDPGCPEAYAHVPERDCSSTRRVTFTPGPSCRLQCLTPTADDFACGC